MVAVPSILVPGSISRRQYSPTIVEQTPLLDGVVGASDSILDIVVSSSTSLSTESDKISAGMG